MNLVKFEHSEKIRLPRPYISMRRNGACYVSSKVASLLDLKHGDTISFSSTEDRQNWYLTNDPDSGALIKKDSGLYRFCDSRLVRKIFVAMGIKGNKVCFPISSEVEKIGDKKYLFMLPKPYNEE